MGSRFLWLAALGLGLPRAAIAQNDGPLLAPPGGQTEEAISASHTKASRSAPSPLGLQADVGRPDGLMAALVVRPIPYVRLHAGGGTNTSSGGIRGGIALLPLGSGPSFNVELGHYFAGEANGLVRASVQGLGKFSSYVNRVAYTFANAHAGMEFGDRPFTFYVHGGLTYLRATLSELAAPDQIQNSQTSIAFNEDPIVRLLTPSAKLGFILYLP